MLHNNLKEIVTDVTQYNRLQTIYDLRDMSYDTRDEKMGVIIAIMKVINGLKYKGIYAGFNTGLQLNVRNYKQSYSLLISYYNKENIVVGNLVKVLKMLICDLNLELPAKPDYKLLKKLIEGNEQQSPKENYDDFFNGILNKTEVKQKETRQINRETNGLIDLDWKDVKFVILGEGAKHIVLKTRADINRTKNTDIIPYLEQKQKEGLPEGIDYIFRNIDKVDGKSRRATYTTLLTAVLFNKGYLAYPSLIKHTENLKKLLEKA